MRKIRTPLIAILLIAILSMTSVTAFASDSAINPRLSHANNANFSFSATANGGYFDVTYLGYDSFVRADLTVTVEKSFLLFWWNEVDTWSGSCTDLRGEFYDTIPLNGSGTYRASFTLKITGNDGTIDTITHEIKDNY